MKSTKIISLILAVMMVLSLFTLTGCESSSPAKLGLGFVASTKVADATEDAEGNGTTAAVAAAVLVDANGKIVACDIDEIEVALKFDFEGFAATSYAFTSKRTLGDNYGMAAYANTTEWYAQVDALEKVIVGKTIDEVNALVVNGTASEEVTKAGCTIYAGELVSAVSKAYANAKVEGATTADKVAVSISAYFSNATDASEEADGKIEADIAFAAVATNKDGKITACQNDAAAASVAFDMEGIAAEAEAIKTKRELGDDYGMAAWANTTEWYVQADALDKYMVGKTADEALKAMDDTGAPNGDVAKAGCTINVFAAVQAIVNAAK